MTITNRIKDILIENMYEMLSIYISEGRSFGLYIWEEDNWDKPLPLYIIEEYGQLLLLNVTEEVIKDMIIDSDGLYVIKYKFGEEFYIKTLRPEYIYSLLDNENGICQINDFIPPEGIKGVIGTYEDIENNLVEIFKIPRENAKKSLEVFKNNKEVDEQKI